MGCGTHRETLPKEQRVERLDRRVAQLGEEVFAFDDFLLGMAYGSRRRLGGSLALLRFAPLRRWFFFRSECEAD